MKKLSFYIFISLIWFNVSYAQTLILFCSDNELIGFDGDSGYQQKSYKPLSFKLRIDMNKKFITSKDLGDSWTIEDFIKCNYWPAFDQYDPMLECMSVGYYIALNMNNYKFTRSRGYGFAFGNKDDIGTGYGTCERIWFQSGQARSQKYKLKMSKRYSGKSFKDSSVMKKAKLSLKEKRKIKREKKKNN